MGCRGRMGVLAGALGVVCMGALSVSCGDDEQVGATDTADAVADTAVPTVATDTTPTIVFDSVSPTVDTAGDTASPVDTAGDGGGGDDTDASVCDGFGCPCVGNGDCLDGLCVEGIDGRVCTKTCVESCPDGFDCVLGGAGVDGTSVCVPRHVRLCRPCRVDADCATAADAFPAFCLPAADPDEGSFCGSGCANRPCPEGFACETVALGSGGSARQCVPEGGAACECRPAWAGLGLVTTCGVTNAFGTCAGTRTCDADGLTACDGPQAQAEQCNGLDDDCSGVTDDVPATSCQVTNEFGSCDGTWGCGDDGIECMGQAAAAETCNGVDDNCDGNTDELSCNDGLACTTDACAGPFDCRNTLQAGFCMIEGACQQALSPNPSNACQVCDPTRSTTQWSVAQNTCTIGGQCYPANAVNTDSPCLVCDPTRSTTSWSQAFNTCNIQGTCYAGGARRPGQECLACDPFQNPSGWSPLGSNVSCDDGSACSDDDHCDGAGQCVGDRGCDDGIACTTDVCTANGCQNTGVEDGWCRIGGQCYTQGTSNPSNVCQRCTPSTSKTFWSASPTSVSCSDGSACTTGDRCSGLGTCLGGTGCSDGLSCTTDLCNPSTGCSYPTASGRCKIQDACYTNGETRPGNVCYKCNPGSSQSGWSLNNGASCNDGNSCTTGDSCSGGGCSGNPITDAYGSNNTQGTASYLGTIGDGDGYPDDARTFSANLYPSGDEDWYRYKVNDNNNVWDPRPRVELFNIPAGTDYHLCVYWKCDDPGDEQSVSCQTGSSSTWSGLPGCCSRRSGTTGEEVDFKTNCDNSGFGADDETGTAYIRVYRASGSATCSNYTVRWGNE